MYKLEANGITALSFRTDEFILKITVPKVTEKVNGRGGKVIEKGNENDGRKFSKNVRIDYF